jgi:pyrrolysine biosynthesis protein PylC
MKVAVVGGKLQGVEAVYLAQQAGWQVLLIDRDPHVPARGLAHSFIQLDVTKDTTELSDIFKDMDLIIPALENDNEKIDNREELTSFDQEKNLQNENWIIQEYLEGPSYSLEVVGVNGNYYSLQPTIIEVDTMFDCKRVIAPADLSEVLKNRFDEIAVTVAEDINLKGIMDIEVILHKKELKILEIDARLPSQTPSVVLKSTGINILELLYDIFNKGNIPVIPPIVNEKPVIYEHIRVNPNTLEVSGEHIISEARPLRYQTDFFGADEALTDFDPDHRIWVATLILTGRTQTEVVQKHHRVLETIRRTFGLQECSDPHPGL